MFAELEGCDACGHPDGVSGEGSGLVHWSERADEVHDFAWCGVGGDGHPSADHFAEGGDVGFDVADVLVTAPRGSEPGHHFVENEERVLFIADFSEAAQEAVCGGDVSHVASKWFDDDCGNVASFRLHDSADGVEIVVGREEGEFRKRFGYAG